MRTCVMAGWGLALTLAAMAGCNSEPQEQVLEVQLNDSSSFEADAGRVFIKVLHADFEDAQSNVGSGALAIDPASVVFELSSTNGATEEDCTAACTSNGLTADDCSAVCTDGKILVRIRISTDEDAEVACAEGDPYGPYLVDLDAEGVGIAVTPTSEPLGADTLAGLNGGQLTLCIGVVAPAEGTVDLEALALTVRP